SESIYPGLQSDDVTIVQQALHYFGYYEGEIDGIYGPLTKKALEIVEEEHDLDLIEDVSQESLTRLYEEEKKEVEEAESSQSADDQEDEDGEQEVKQIETENTTNTDVVEVAHSLIGTPYTWGGDSPSGF